MDIKVNHKIIKDLCGTVSFKRGEAFYTADKVKLENCSNVRCEGIVYGAEEFAVTVEKVGPDGFRADCSCPKLASVKNECQHVAAVLLAIEHKQKQVKNPSSVQSENREAYQGIADDLLTIFNGKHRRTSGHQLHFERRKVLNAEFNLKLISLDGNENMIGINMTIHSHKISEIRDFLKMVKVGESHVLSQHFTYDPVLHCFGSETDDVIKKLMIVRDDEKVYVDSLHSGFVGEKIGRASCRERV